MREVWPLSQLLFYMLLEILARKVRQEIEIRDVGSMEEVKLSMFADDMSL